MISYSYYYVIRIFFNLLSFIFELFVRIAFPEKTTHSTPTGKPLQVDIDLEEALTEVSEKYLSFAVDTSKALGGYWWGSSGVIEIGKGKEKTTPLDFANEKLIKLAKALSPAYLRIGGTEADNILFDTETKVDTILTMNKQTWDNINNFSQKTELELFYTVNAGPLVRDEAHDWNSKNFEKLLQYSKKQGYKLAALELGNELNAYWFFHGLCNRITPTQYIKDFNVFRTIIKKYYPAAQVGGTASLYWPRVGEAFSFVGSLLPKFIKNTSVQADMFTWHYYPQQSQRSPITLPKAKHGLLLQPQYLNDIAKWANTLSHIKNTFNHQSEIWISEIGNALCGGQPGISNTFESSLWWADTLGSMAVSGQKVIIRQDLVGSDYSLLDEKTLDPRPDFYVSLLWKKLMGTKVFTARVSKDNDYIRVYAHATSQTLEYSQDAVTLVFINLQNKKNNVFLNNLPTDKIIMYELTSESLNGKSIILNNKRITHDKGIIPALEGKQITVKNKLLEFAPLSITFLVIPHAR